MIVANRLSPALTFGGANLNFFRWVDGPKAHRDHLHPAPDQRHSGLPVRVARYAAQLVQNHANLTWSIEGGDLDRQATASGVRDPALHHRRRRAQVYLVPTSIVYDQLHEVEAMTTEAYGAVSLKTFASWFGWRCNKRLGRAYLDFGEPLPRRKRLEEMRADECRHLKSSASHWTSILTEPPRSPDRRGESRCWVRTGRCLLPRCWPPCSRWPVTSRHATGRVVEPLT